MNLKYIDFNFKNQNKLFYIAILVLVLSHVLHFAKPNINNAIFFKSLFIIAYILFLISEFLKDGRIHIASLSGKLVIILLVASSIYHDIKNHDYQNLDISNIF